jgi:hypothetical protein
VPDFTNLLCCLLGVTLVFLLPQRFFCASGTLVRNVFLRLIAAEIPPTCQYCGKLTTEYGFLVRHRREHR